VWSACQCVLLGIYRCTWRERRVSSRDAWVVSETDGHLL